MPTEEQIAIAMIFCGILIGFIASAFVFYERPKEEIEEPAKIKKGLDK